MPIYVFLCRDTHQRFEVRFPSIAAYEHATIHSPFTGTENVTRVIDQVTVLKGGPGFEALVRGDEQALAPLDQADARALAGHLRDMAAESGTPPSDDFAQVVDRLAHGQSAQEIDQAMPPARPQAEPRIRGEEKENS